MLKQPQSSSREHFGWYLPGKWDGLSWERALCFLTDTGTSFGVSTCREKAVARTRRRSEHRIPNLSSAPAHLPVPTCLACPQPSSRCCGAEALCTLPLRTGSGNSWRNNQKWGCLGARGDGQRWVEEQRQSRCKICVAHPSVSIPQAWGAVFQVCTPCPPQNILPLVFRHRLVTRRDCTNHHPASSGPKNPPKFKLFDEKQRPTSYKGLFLGRVLSGDTGAGQNSQRAGEERLFLCAVTSGLPPRCSFLWQRPRTSAETPTPRGACSHPSGAWGRKPGG